MGIESKTEYSERTVINKMTGVITAEAWTIFDVAGNVFWFECAIRNDYVSDPVARRCRKCRGRWGTFRSVVARR